MSLKCGAGADPHGGDDGTARTVACDLPLAASKAAGSPEAARPRLPPSGQSSQSPRATKPGSRGDVTAATSLPAERMFFLTQIGSIFFFGININK